MNKQLSFEITDAKHDVSLLLNKDFRENNSKLYFFIPKFNLYLRIVENVIDDTHDQVFAFVISNTYMTSWIYITKDSPCFYEKYKMYAVNVRFTDTGLTEEDIGTEIEVSDNAGEPKCYCKGTLECILKNGRYLVSTNELHTFLSYKFARRIIK